MGAAAAVATSITTELIAAGVGEATAGMLAAGLVDATIGAAGGAALGGITGSDPGQLALMGGLTEGFMGGLGGGLTAPASAGLSLAATSGMSGGLLGAAGLDLGLGSAVGMGLGAAAGNFVGGLATGQNVGQAALGGLEAGALTGATAGLTGGGGTPQGASGTGLGAAPTLPGASVASSGMGADLTMTAPTASSAFSADIAAAEASDPAIMGPSVESSLGIGGSMGAGSTFYPGAGTGGMLGQAASGAGVNPSLTGAGGTAQLTPASAAAGEGGSYSYGSSTGGAQSSYVGGPAPEGTGGVQPLDQLVQSAGPSATSALTGAPQLGVPSTGGTSLNQLTGTNAAGTSALTGAPAAAAASAQPGLAQRILTSLGVGPETAGSISKFVSDNSKAIGGAGIMGAKLLSSSGTTPQEQQMEDLLAQLGQGTKTNYTAETLPADQQLDDQRNVQAAVQQVKNHYAQLGLSGSSQEMAAVQDVYNRSGQIAGAQADALNQQGNAAKPQQASVVAQLAAMQQAQSQQQSDAISQFAQGLFA